MGMVAFSATHKLTASALEESNIVLNGGFETGDLTNWQPNSDPNRFSASNAKARTGEYSLCANSMDETPTPTWNKIYQSFSVEPNTDYVISFWYKGTIYTSSTNWSVAPDKVNIDNSMACAKGGLGSSTTWKQFLPAIFNSGDNTQLYLFFIFNLKVEFYIDDIQIEKAIVKNGGFETGTLSSWNTEAGYSVATVGVHSGAHSLRAVDFPAGNNVIYQALEVTPYTDYSFSFWYKNTVGTAATNYSIAATVGDLDGGIVKGQISTAAWTQVTRTFNSGQYSRLYLHLNFNTGVAIYIDDIVCTTVLPGIKNGGFEAGALTSWTAVAEYSASTTEKLSGEYSLYANCTDKWNKIYQLFSVVPNTEYTLTFWYMGTFGDPCTNYSVTTMLDKLDTIESIVHGGLGNKTSWEKMELTFNSGPNAQLYLYFMFNGLTKNAQFYIDEVSLAETNPVTAVVRNGGLETENLAWWTPPDGSGFSASAEDKLTGAYSMKLVSAESTKIHQIISVNADTGYALSFWYKGQTGTGADNFCVSAAEDDFDNGLVKGSLGENATFNDWTQKVVYFSSGENTKLYLHFQTHSTGTQEYALYIDDIQIDESKVLVNSTISGGTVAVDETNGEAGSRVEITVTPDSGKVLKAGGLTFTIGGITYPLHQRVGSVVFDNQAPSNESNNAVYFFAMPDGQVEVNAVFVDVGAANLSVFGASIRPQSGEVVSGLQFGSRIYRQYGTGENAYGLTTCGTLFLRADSVGELDLEDGAAVEAWVQNNPNLGRKLPSTALMDRCGDFVDIGARLINVTENVLENREYIAIAYGTYRNSVNETLTLYSEPLTRSYAQVEQNT